MGAGEAGGVCNTQAVNFTLKSPDFHCSLCSQTGYVSLLIIPICGINGEKYYRLENLLS